MRTFSIPQQTASSITMKDTMLLPNPYQMPTDFRLTNLFTIALTMMISCMVAQQCRAASDCDVKIIKVNSVEIEKDKITIVAEASISMVIITPVLPKDAKSLRFVGRDSTRIRIKADEATFTVLRTG